MKRLLSSLLVLVLLCSLCGCDKVQTLIGKYVKTTPETKEIVIEQPAEPEDSDSDSEYVTIVGDDPIMKHPWEITEEDIQEEEEEIPTPAPTPTPEPEPEQPKKPDVIEVTDAQMQQIVDEFFVLINEERTRLGLNPLTENSALNGFAQIRAEETLTLFSHTRPDGQDWNTVIDQAAYPYQTAGENLVMTSHVGDQSYNPNKDYWTGSPEQISAAAGWIFKLFRESEAHYENIKNASFRESGIGITYVMNDTNSIPIFYLTHLFGSQQENP